MDGLSGNGLPSFSELSHLAATAEYAARKAGDVLLSWQKRFTVSEKSRSNLVTEADFAAQKVIEQIVRAQFPDHAFVGEEDLNDPGRNETEYCWIIDPLDGTGNYVHGMPYFSVSIGLTFRSQLIVGIVYDPTRDECFRAVKNAGARLNGQVIQCSTNYPLKNAMCLASLPVAGDPKHPAVARFLNVLSEARTVQRLGSAALNLAYLACGRIDGFWSQTLKPWDMAGGVIIATEAGAKITKMDGTTFDLFTPDLLGTNGSVIHHELQTRLQIPVVS